MNNLTTSLNYEYSPFGEALAEIARAVLPLTEKTELKAHEYDLLVRSLWVVNHMTTKKSHSKLDGGCSVSTDCHNCHFCWNMWKKAQDEVQKTGKTNIICASCYSDTDGKLHRGLANRNMLNKAILNVQIPQEVWDEAFQIPMFREFFRVQSFGETDTVTEACNFIRMCRAIGRRWNSIPCGVWSKNSSTWGAAFKLLGKPENMTYVQSSPRINVRTPIAPCIKQYCDHRFTVFSPDHLAKHPEIKINCGGRSCKDCVKRKIRCYFHGGEFDINEVLK